MPTSKTRSGTPKPADVAFSLSGVVDGCLQMPEEEG
jgi:hypothetical protein